MAQKHVPPRCLSSSQSREVCGSWQAVLGRVLAVGSIPLDDEHGNGFSVAFIPGRLSDHDLLDDKYVYRLRMMSLKVPGDPLDDVADDVRYGIYTFITTTEKPLELRIAEAVRPLVEQRDLTSAVIRTNQMLAESASQNRPARIGRRR